MQVWAAAAVAKIVRMSGATGTASPALQEPPAAAPTAEKEAPASDASLLQPLLVSREECAYARCYCEENVFHLCRRLSDALPPSLTVSALFISNARRCVPVWGQRRGEEEEDGDNAPMLWDYHVVCLVEPPPSTAPAVVYDLDTSLQPFPCRASTYVQEAFRPQLSLQEEFRQRFRLVPFPALQRRFASDRSHMRKPDGGWNAPPPPWPPIRGPDAGSAMTLPQFWEVGETAAPGDEGVDDGELGTVLSLSGLMRRLGMMGGGD